MVDRSTDGRIAALEQRAHHLEGSIDRMRDDIKDGFASMLDSRREEIGELKVLLADHAKGQEEHRLKAEAKFDDLKTWRTQSTTAGSLMLLALGGLWTVGSAVIIGEIKSLRESPAIARPVKP